MPEHKKFTLIVIVLISVVALSIALIPGITGNAPDWTGTDDLAKNKIMDTNAGYEPWFSPILKPPGSGMESFLFSIQAAIGAGIIGYVAGFYTGKKKRDD